MTIRTSTAPGVRRILDSEEVRDVVVVVLLLLSLLLLLLLGMGRR